MPEPQRITIRGPQLYRKQHAAIFARQRFSWIEASTKAGKTVGALAWQGFNVCAVVGEHWWVAPVYGQAEIAFKRAKRYFPEQLYTANNSKLRLSFCNGSVWHFKSAQNPDNLYGEDVCSAVVDEASRCKAETLPAIRSTLTATQGPARFIGNVKGRNTWFYERSRYAEHAEDPAHAYFKLTAFDAVRAGVLAMEEIEEARRSLSEATFKELYLAEPADDGSNPFGLANIERIIAPGLSNRPTVAWGWDLGKYVDFTFGVGLDEYGCVTQVWRWKDSWERTVDRIAALVGNTPALVDSTGAGDMPVERLQLRCGKLEGFKFSSRSKQQLMEGLAIAIGNEELSVVEDHGLASELRNFEYEVTRTGVRYTAPPGYHDDGVMALALAEYRLRNKSTYIFDTAPRL